MRKYKYNINNLDCAGCALSLEEKLNNNKELSNVSVNFTTSKISYETDTITIDELNKIVKKIEPDVTITEDIKQDKEYHITVLVLGLILTLLSIIIKVDILDKIFIIVAYMVLLYKPFTSAYKMLVNSRTINENALITISSIGAYLVGSVMEGIMVVTLYLIGKILEEKAISNSRKSIADLVSIKQDYANKITEDGIVTIDVDDIKVKDQLVIKKGEKVPVDGIVIEGNTLLDTKALTGESELKDVKIDDKVISGSINAGDVITIRATHKYVDSTVFKILELVEDASESKAHTETFVSKISKIYTPIILILAILVVIILPLTGVSLNDSIYRGLTFLVISCPCAIAISVPLSYFTGIGVSSSNGILIKGSNYLDNLSHIKKIIFDKTGTLTDGTFEVTDIDILDKSYTKKEVIDILVKGESLSNHPIAKSIMRLTNKQIDNKDVKDFKELEGLGISFKLGKDIIKIGTKDVCCDIDTNLHLNINGNHVAAIKINDGIKENAIKVIKDLRNNNIITYMFTGDKKEVALLIGEKLGIDDVKYEMLPTDKYSEYEKIENNDIVAFVGDGVNDAPTLKRSSIGIAMGGIGSSSAIDASDVVIMNDDLAKITKAIDISKYTNNIIKQNLIFAISVKILILILSVFGLTTMWEAVFADTGVTLLTIVNTLRIMKKYK